MQNLPAVTQHIRFLAVDCPPPPLPPPPPPLSPPAFKLACAAVTLVGSAAQGMLISQRPALRYQSLPRCKSRVHRRSGAFIDCSMRPSDLSQCQLTHSRTKITFTMMYQDIYSNHSKHTRTNEQCCNHCNLRKS